jgi:hypothetical protein
MLNLYVRCTLIFSVVSEPIHCNISHFVPRLIFIAPSAAGINGKERISNCTTTENRHPALHPVNFRCLRDSPETNQRFRACRFHRHAEFHIFSGCNLNVGAQFLVKIGVKLPPLKEA